MIRSGVGGIISFTLIGYVGLHIAWVTSVFIGIVFFAHALRQPRSPAATAAWLLLVLLVPVIGLLIFLAFGVRKEQSPMAQLLLTVHDETPEEHADPVDLLIRRFGLPGATAGNTIRILGTPSAAYHELTELIDTAKKFIHVETFVFHLDEVGQTILDKLCAKARAGVEVRVLVDAMGTLPVRRKHFRPLTEAGGKFRMFVPFLHRRGRTNLRDHRKIALADGRRVMAGGTNIAAEYLGPTNTPDQWKDLAFALEGPSVSHYAEIFRADWSSESGEVLGDAYVTPPEPWPPGDQQVQVVPSGPDLSRDVLYDAIVQLFFNARSRIRVVTPYFVPDDTLTRALALAAVRGLDVQIISPLRSNHTIANFARGTYLRELAEYGVRVRFYEPGMVHAKVMTVDDRIALVGSANFDLRSMFLNYEVTSFFYGGREVAEVDAWVDALDAESVDGPERAGHMRQVAEGLARVVAPLV